MSDDSEDIVLVTGKAERAESWSVLRRRAGNLEAGELRPMVEGQPIVGDIVKLSPREEHALLFDVEVLHATPRSGPAQVATQAYRDGWDMIFGGMGKKGEA